MRQILLDTSAWTAHRRGHPEVAEAVASADSVAINVTVLGELLQGFRAGSRPEKNRADLERFRSSPRFRLLALDEDTADRYALIVTQLRRAGTPIPTNDCWIAASAYQHGLELLTTDHHFLAVSMVAVRYFDAGLSPETPPTP